MVEGRAQLFYSQKNQPLCNRVLWIPPASRDQPHSDVLGMNRALLEENGRRQDLASFLQGRHHKMSLEVGTLSYPDPDPTLGR